MKNRWNEASGGGKTKGLLMKSVLCNSFRLLDNLNSFICVHLILYPDFLSSKP